MKHFRGLQSGPVKVLVVFGTRPEAIKLARVVDRFAAEPDRFSVQCCSTGQHRDLLAPVLDVFSLRCEYELNAMTPGQTLFGSTSRILSALEPVLAAARPDLVVVQGDTTTTLAGALAGFYAGAAVAHIEAGLRTYNMREPFPEEMNRVLVSRLATLHFAATAAAAEALRREGITENVSVTGNTGIDALLWVRDRLASGQLQASHGIPLDPTRRLIVLTTHRRESFGEPLRRTCSAIARLAVRSDVQIVCPVHPNPEVRRTVFASLQGLPTVHLCDPLGYVDFVDLMRRCHILLTDSGGVQEEASILAKPVLVLREHTERTEGVQAGAARLVGTNAATIEREVALLLDNEAEYQQRSQPHAFYGDGQAANRISEIVAGYFLNA